MKKLICFIISCALTFSLFFNASAQVSELKFPGTEVFITPPEHFELTKDENGNDFLYHSGTKAIIQLQSRNDISYKQSINSITPEYFSEQNMVLLMAQNPSMPDGSEASLYICSARYHSDQQESLSAYTVLIFIGGNETRSFFATARFPDQVKDLLMNEILNSLFSIRF